ncbi:hypothetical protein AX14_002349 [Amanita brunnescens Koide BX004]|nr:hypothetical protein AX14_002349 [Amanita brunnescens Koide BX004]
MAPKLRVAIVGAGIGGLMMACCIAQMDKWKWIEMDIYEASAELAEIGAGIIFPSKIFEMLSKIGLGDDILKYCERQNADSSPTFNFRKSDQKNGHPILDVYGQGGIFKIHRADLQRVLLKMALAHARVHLANKLVSYTEHPDSISLEFENGSKRTCHLLVGADGIKSIVRKLFLASRPGQESSEPVWTGTYAYRGLIQRDVLLKAMPSHRVTRLPAMYVGKLKNVVVYPISKGAFINVVGLVHDETREETRHEGPWFKNVSKAEVLSVFQGFEREAQALFECIQNPSKWAIHHLIPLKKYAEGRVLLLGDAAHAMGPHLAAGAGQAMEDAYVLSCILLNSNFGPNLTSQIHLIAQTYDAIRRPIGNAIIALTKKRGKLNELTDDEKELPVVKAHDDKVPHEVLVAYMNKSERCKNSLLDMPDWEEQCRNALKLLRSLRKVESKM